MCIKIATGNARPHLTIVSCGDKENDTKKFNYKVVLEALFYLLDSFYTMPKELGH